jgi:hypothetical protein
MTLVYQTTYGEFVTWDLEDAWRHALCCFVRVTVGQMGWWASEIIEATG